MAQPRMLIERMVLLAAAAMLVVGCGPKSDSSPANANAGGSYIFYPEKPAPPRLQYLTTITDGGEVTRPKSGSFADWVVGTEPSQAGTTKFNGPYGMDAADGKLYVCDVASDRVHVVDLNARTYSVLGTPEVVRNPVNIAIDDGDGTRYVCDTGSRRIHVFDRQDNYVRSIVADPEWTPIDVSVRNGQLYVCDVTGGQVWILSTAGDVIRKFSRKGNGPDELSMPTNLEVGPDGRIYVVDSLQQVVKVFDVEGNYLDTIGRPGADIGGFARPKGIAIDKHGVVYVADSQWDVVQLFSLKGELLLVFGEPGEERHAMGLPAGLAIDSTSLPAFRKYLAPNFEAEYLLFVVNQFGKNKLVVYAYGRDKTADY